MKTLYEATVMFYYYYHFMTAATADTAATPADDAALFGSLSRDLLINTNYLHDSRFVKWLCRDPYRRRLTQRA